MFLTFSEKKKKIIKYAFVLNLLASWQETFADAGDGDGGEE